MATTLKAILDVTGQTIEASGIGSGDVRAYGWKRLADSAEPRVQSGCFRLLVGDGDRDPEFGVGAEETLSTLVTAEFYRPAQVEGDPEFFAELSRLANVSEGATYPSGTIAVIARARTVSRQFSDPSWIVGAIVFQVKWEQAF